MADPDLSAVPPEDNASGEYVAKTQMQREQELMQSIDRLLAEEPTEQPTDTPGFIERDETLRSNIAEAAADVGEGMVEMPAAVTRGVLDAATEFTETIGQIADPLASFLEEKIPLGQAPTPDEINALAKEFLDGLGLEKPDTAIGGITQGIAQFMTGFIPAMRATKALGVGQKIGAGGKLVEAGIAGSIADVTVFDEQDARLSDLIESFPALRNPVTNYLKSDPNDSVAEGKLKLALEGIVPGVMVDSTVAGLRAFSKVRRARLEAEAEAGDPEVVMQRAREEAAELPRESAAKLGLSQKTLYRMDKNVKERANTFLAGGPEKLATKKRPRGGQAPEDAPDVIGSINLNRVSGDEDVRKIIERTATLFEDKVTGTARSNENTIRLANKLSQDPDKMLEVMKRRRGKAFTATEITALRFLVEESASGLDNLAKKISTGQADEVDQFLFRQRFAFHAMLLEQTSSAAREAGRALQSFQIEAGGRKAQRDFIRGALAAATETGKVDAHTLATAMRAIETEEGLHKFIRDTSRATTKEMFVEAWINALLSGPQTHVVNTVSNSLFSLWQIPETMMATQLRKLVGGLGVGEGEAMERLYGLTHGLVDGIRLGYKAAKTGMPSDRFLKIEGLQQPAITGKNILTELGSGPTGKLTGLSRLNVEDPTLQPLVRGLDFLGVLARIPGRALTAEDEFFKAIGYRMELQTQAYRTARREGLEGKEMATRMQEIINNPPDEIRIAAIEQGRIQTFTNPLGETGRNLQQSLQSIELGNGRLALPAGRLIVPFFRTPVNLAKAVGLRSPLAPLAKSFQADLRAGGARADLATARMALGSFTMMAFMDMAASGAITGNGPSDPALRAAMRRTGWQPYSIKTKNGYVSYARTDPVGMTIGIGADLAEIMGELDRDEAASVAGGVIVAVANNIISKTYMEGISNFMEVFHSGTLSPQYGERVADRYVLRLGGSLIPAASAQIARTVDPTLRHADTLVDTWRSRIPGYSDSLPPRVNLWGDPIVLSGGWGPDIMSPFWQSLTVDSPVDQEMINNGFGVTMPLQGTRNFMGVELTHEQANEYIKLAGQDWKDPSTGLGAKERLERIVTGKDRWSERYRNATSGPEGGKAAIIRFIIMAHREGAKAAFLTKHPQIARQVKELSIQRAEDMGILPQSGPVGVTIQ